MIGVYAPNVQQNDFGVNLNNKLADDVNENNISLGEKEEIKKCPETKSGKSGIEMPVFFVIPAIGCLEILC